MEFKLQLEKFVGAGYMDWKEKSQLLLYANDMGELIGSSSPPSVPDKNSNKNEGGDPQPAKPNPKMMKAVSILKLALGTQQFQEVRGLNTVDAIYAKLDSIYLSTDVASAHLFFKKLFSGSHMQEGDTIKDHILKLTNIFDELAARGWTLQEEIRVFALLGTLTEDFDQVSANITFQMTKKVDLEATKQALILDEAQRIARGEQHSSVALAARSNLQRDPKKKKDKKPKATTTEQQQQQATAKQKTDGKGTRGCGNCGKDGHSTPNCTEKWILPCRVCLRNKKTSIHKEADCPFNKQNKQQFSCLATFGLSTETLDPDAWYVDSGASSHMSDNRDLFVTFTEDFGHTVRGIGNKLLRSAGIGDVCIQTVVDGTIHDVTLEDVVYFPYLGTSLFSTGVAMRRKCKVVMEDTSCTVAKDGVTFITAEMGDDTMLKLDLTYPNITETPTVESLSLIAVPTDGGARDADAVGKAGRNYLVSAGSVHHSVCGMSAQLDISQVPGLSSAKKHLLWHDRLGHISDERVRKTVDITEGMDKLSSPPQFNCDACSEGKAHAAPIFDGPIATANEPGELMHTDLAGPVVCAILTRDTGTAVFVDHVTRFGWVYGHRSKGDYPNTFKRHHKLLLAQHDRSVKRVRCDNGGEYIANALTLYANEFGIVFERTAPHTPSQNGVAERRIRSLWNIARSLLAHAQLPPSFWEFAINVANVIVNCTSSNASSGNRELTYYEQWYGTRPNLSNLRTFGCRAKVLIQTHLTKPDSRTRDCIYLGPSPDSAGDLFFALDTKRVIVSRNATFFEADKLYVSPLPTRDPSYVASLVSAPKRVDYFDISVFLPDTKVTPLILPANVGSIDIFELETRDSLIASRAVTPGDDPPPAPPDPDPPPPVSPVVAEPAKPAPTVQVPPAPTRSSTRAKSFSNRPDFLYGTSDNLCKGLIGLSEYQDRIETIAFIAALAEHKTMRGALSSKDAQLYLEAMVKEVDALTNHGTYKLVPLPFGRKVIKCKWVYKVKLDGDGNFDRLKARLVALGFTQRKGVDYFETFSPVARQNSLKIFYAVAAWEGLTVRQFDIDSAYLNGLLDTEIYMQQPPGFEDPEHPDWVCLLLKGLYGLKQAGRLWHDVLKSFLLERGWIRCSADPCIFIRFDEHGRAMVAVYVDDMSHAGTDAAYLRFKAELLECFNIKDLGESKFIVGIQVTQSPKGITLTQSTNISKILAEQHMSDAHPAPVPLTKGDDISITGTSDSPVDGTKYRGIVGKLLYICNTRPDITFAVHTLSRFNKNPSQRHLKLVQRICKYLRGTTNLCLFYPRGDGSPLQLEGYVDSDWANDKDTRRSVTGYVFFINGSPVTWKSTRQPTVALSSTEAEYMAAKDATKEAIWIRRLLADLGHPQSEPTLMNEDNQGCIHLIQNPVHHERTKHIDVQYHFTREQVELGTVEYKYLNSGEQRADLLTKPLLKDDFEYLLRKFNLHSTL